MNLNRKGSIEEIVDSSVQSVIEAFSKTISQARREIELAALWMIEALKNENKIIFFGNGGSAADSQHLAAELVNRFRLDRKPLPGLALTTDSSILTSISNDFGYEQVFSKQLEAMCNAGDVAIGISTSGSSENVVLGIKTALAKEAKTIALTGKDGGPAAEIADLAIKAESSDTPRIQEVHIFVGHLLCDIVEKELFG